MRYLAVLFTTLALAACSTAPVPRSESKAVSPGVVQFLLTAAANDFHTRRPLAPVCFRDVRVGHVMSPAGEAHYSEARRLAVRGQVLIHKRGFIRLQQGVSIFFPCFKRLPFLWLPCPFAFAVEFLPVV